MHTDTILWQIKDMLPATGYKGSAVDSNNREIQHDRPDHREEGRLYNQSPLRRPVHNPPPFSWIILLTISHTDDEESKPRQPKRVTAAITPNAFSAEQCLMVDSVVHLLPRTALAAMVMPHRHRSPGALVPHQRSFYQWSRHPALPAPETSRPLIITSASAPRRRPRSHSHQAALPAHMTNHPQRSPQNSNTPRRNQTILREDIYLTSTHLKRRHPLTSITT